MQFYGQSQTPYVRLDDAAQVLRVSRWTLYRNLEDIPHIRVGPYILIACEFLLLEPPAVRVGQKVYRPRHYFQPFLPFDMPQDGRRWRNSQRLLPGTRQHRENQERLRVEQKARKPAETPEV